MVRRAILLCVLGLAVTAAPALAAMQWNSAMKDGTATKSRTSNGKCSFGAGSEQGWLQIRCSAGGKATVTYQFTSSRSITGTPTFSVDPAAGTVGRLTVGGKTLTLKLTVSGAHTIQVHSVSVGYYTK